MRIISRSGRRRRGRSVCASLLLLKKEKFLRGGIRSLPIPETEIDLRRRVRREEKEKEKNEGVSK
jgi:hypothetical protein